VLPIIPSDEPTVRVEYRDDDKFERNKVSTFISEIVFMGLSMIIALDGGVAVVPLGIITA
jgi:hypothetical protein